MTSLVATFDSHFRLLYERSGKLVKSVPNELLYMRSGTPKNDLVKLTVGENIARSAALIEMTFGGITTRLWDDPFEWTLPETLNDNAKICNYLDDVEATRRRGFALFKTDEDLGRSIPAPRELRTIGEILIDTLAGAEKYFGRAQVTFEILIGENAPG